MFCKNCGSSLAEGAQFCANCGTPVAESGAVKQTVPAGKQKSKMAAGLLGIFLGGGGIHNFYLGFTGKAVAQLILTLVSCGIGSIWGFIEGIMILAGNINTDANGVPLGE